jgi:hypothetical protein
VFAAIGGVLHKHVLLLSFGQHGTKTFGLLFWQFGMAAQRSLPMPQQSACELQLGIAFGAMVCSPVV